jgi:hypothetical protein
MDEHGDGGRKAYARTREELASIRVTWPVREDYYIRDGYLCGKEVVVREYDPLDYHQIVAEFAKLREGDDGALVQFARRWGSLEGEGYIPPRWTEDDWTDEDEVRPQGYVTSPSDAVHSVWGYVRSVRLVLELNHYLQRGDRDGLARFLDSYRVPSGKSRKKMGQEEGPLIAWESLIVGGRVQERFSWGQPVGEAAVAVAEDIMTTIVSDGLTYMGHELACRPFRVLPNWSNLLAAIYWHLANIVAGSRPLIRCQDPTCGALFLQTDRRQRYCPAPTGWTGKTGSLCGARARKRRNRQEKGG